jgi:hypothetical protein
MQTGIWNGLVCSLWLWVISCTKIRGPGSVLYETGWLWQCFIQQSTALSKIFECTEEWIFSKCQAIVVPTHMHYILFYYLTYGVFFISIYIYIYIYNLILIHGRFVVMPSVNSQMLQGSNVWMCGNNFFFQVSQT